MFDFKKLLLISRPHIWIYTLGSFLFGLHFGCTGNAVSGDTYSGAHGSSIYGTFCNAFYGHSHRPFEVFGLMDFVSLFTLLYTILWLTVGANIFLYAQNDAFDTESDVDNPKKTDFEYRAVAPEKKSLLSLSYIFLCAYIPILFFIPSVTVYVFTVWVLIVVTYNTPPLRLKAVPLLDCIFSFNFPLWGVFGYSLVTGALPSLTYLVFLGAFSILCHIYTAIGDIEYDKKSSIYTTAVLFKSERNNILVCIFGMIALVIYMHVLLPATEKLYVLPLTLYVLFFISHVIYEHYNKRGTAMHIWYSWFIKLHYIVGFLFTLILMY